MKRLLFLCAWKKFFFARMFHMKLFGCRCHSRRFLMILTIIWSDPYRSLTIFRLKLSFSGWLLETAWEFDLIIDC